MERRAAKSCEAQVSEAVWLSTFQDARALQLTDATLSSACPAPWSGSASRAATCRSCTTRSHEIGRPGPRRGGRSCAPSGAATTPLFDDRSDGGPARRSSAATAVHRSPERHRRRHRRSEPQATPSRPSSSGRQPLRPRRRAAVSPRRRPGPTTRCSSTAPPAWARPTCSTPSATTSTQNYAHYRVRYVSTETFLNEFVDAIRTEHHRSSSSGATAMSTCCSSTTSSSWRARRGSRRSSSTRSTPSTAPTSRS